PTPPPISKYPSKEVFLSQSNNTIPSLPSPPEPFYSSDPTPPPISVSYDLASVSDSSLNSLDLELDSLSGSLSEEESYSSDLQKTPVAKYSSISKSNDTLAGLPDLEPFYSSDPTPVPILGKQTSPEGKLEETLGAFPPKPESAYSSESININEKASISNFKLEETLGAFSDSDPFRSRGMASTPKTNYSEMAKENADFNKPHSATEPVYSLPSLLSPTLRIEEGNIVTRPLASESFYIGEEFEEIIRSSIKEEVKAVEQVDVDIDVAFEQAGIGESAEELSVSKYLILSSEQAYKEVYQLSPSAVIYLFAEYFVPTLLSGQRGRQMHNSFSTERERLAALLLVSALFSLFCRGVIELSVGSSTQKKQIALSQKNEGIIIRAVNLDIPALDILETKIVDSLKQSGTTRFYNIFLYIAQTSVATSQREAICEIVTDMIADELSVRKFLQARQKNRRLESGESAIQYELACDLLPYHNQALAVQDWLQGLQQQASIELAGKTVQPFIHILKYYTDLFRHNSKELSKS
ncbi:MAG: hypothetical protein HY819_16930, partial [Acidobacteria bacterium]|nr:hypothetical protein [Acidobacteriota bacterium]